MQKMSQQFFIIICYRNIPPAALKNRTINMAAHMEPKNCQIWVGAQTGILKGIDLKKNATSNFTDLTALEKDKEITCMCWSSDEEEKVLLGLRNGTVRSFNSKEATYEDDLLDCGTEEGVLKALLTVEDERLVTCQASGMVRVWERDNPEKIAEINVGENVCKMRQNPRKRHHIATGGKENGLKVWDLEKPGQPIFRAKNVRNDFLDLRVPIWVNDMQFLENSSKIVTCTGHHQVRLYDPSSSQRRPVFNVEFDEYPLMALALNPGNNSVIVGNTQGKMAEIDFRKENIVRIYKGLAGSTRDIVRHPSLPLVASCGLDRFLRVHDTQDGSIRNKIYLKSRLNCLLFSSKDFTQEEEKGVKEKERKEKKAEDEDEESELIWQKMKTIREESAPRSDKKRRKARPSNKQTKNIRN